ncbi:hypothetical protein E2C01_032097 [Portunus trituberculatus]|uniref:Uncharacterized protein n=1 Tax=Portunus trituberculatus TaxID=210409 RepID=A0A5B7F022_PORTR|nr:hypothetical protein [Portunus trituberculatus]
MPRSHVHDDNSEEQHMGNTTTLLSLSPQQPNTSTMPHSKCFTTATVGSCTMELYIPLASDVRGVGDVTRKCVGGNYRVYLARTALCCSRRQVSR